MKWGWKAVSPFTLLSTHSFHFCLDLKLPANLRLSYISFFLSFFLSCLFLSSVDCEAVGGLIEDAFLWGTKVILSRLYASLSKADTLLKNYSPHWVPRQPMERLWKGLKGMGDKGGCHCPPTTVLWCWKQELSPLLEVAGVVSSHLHNCSTTSPAVINWDSCRCGVQVHQAGVSC